MITSRDIKFIVIGILIFLISRYLYDRFFKPQKKLRKKPDKKLSVVKPVNIKKGRC